MDESYVWRILFQVKIAYHDGSPVVDTNNKVKISRSANWDQANSSSEDYTLDSNGMIYIKYSVPANDSGVYFFVSLFISTHIAKLLF